MSVRPRYADRADAGRRLTEAVAETTIGRSSRGTGVAVLGLARGGVPVAAPLATWLGVPVDALVVAKLRHRTRSELALGAVACVGDDDTGLEVVCNDDLARELHVAGADLDAELARRTADLRAAQQRYRGSRPPPALAGRSVLVVDDGLATGASMRAAVGAVRRAGAAQVVVAVPIGAPASVAELAAHVDAVVCPWSPPGFRSVSQGYRDFRQVPDEEVLRLLAR